MPEKQTDSSTEIVEKMKHATNEFKDTLMDYFKENNVEVKDWKFAVENSESSYIIDATVKIKISPKAKNK